jgi:hypothetical protein
MQKINQPDASDKALDVAVQPLTPAEIQQVSGGNGQNRFMGVGPSPAARPGQAAAMPGRTIHLA